MIIQIVNGAKKFDVEVPDYPESDENWTLSKFKEEIEKLTKIPADSQRLILKGRTVFGDNTLITNLGLKPGDKIMVLSGSKPQGKNDIDPNFKNLERIETTVISGMDAKLNEFDSTLDGVEKGFLNEELVQNALVTLEKQLKHFGEDCMKTLELMDSMPLGENNKARVKRKTLVNTVQDLLQRHDALKEKLSSFMTSNVQNKS